MCRLFGVLIVVLTMTFTAVRPAMAADATADDILKAKGLTKVGQVYLLATDANIATQLRAMRAAEKKANQALRRRALLERDLRSDVAALNALHDRNAAETAILEGTSKNAIGSYNHQVRKVNAVRDLVRAGVKVIEKKRKVLAGLVDPSDEFVTKVLELAAAIDRTAEQYAALAADAEVTAALAKINEGATTPLRLGPSDRFSTDVAMLHDLREKVNGASIKFDIVGGVPSVPITINDSVKIDIVFDSGAAMMTLTSETAAKLEIPSDAAERREKFRVADGSVVEGRVVTLKSVRLGDFRVEDIECAILSSNAKGATDLLGGSFLQHFVYRMDLAAGVVKMSHIPREPDQDDDGDADVAAKPDAPKPPPAKAGKGQAEILIVSAKWGGGSNWADVTKRVQTLFAADKTIRADNGVLGADPTPGWRKQLQITFTRDETKKTLHISEGNAIEPERLRTHP